MPESLGHRTVAQPVPAEAVPSRRRVGGWPLGRPARPDAGTVPASRGVQGRPPASPWRRFGFDVFRGAAAILLLHLFVLQISVVRGQSMEPSLFDGDRLVVDRVWFLLDEIGRFDVIVLRYPRDPMIDFVKRVIGLPGDIVEIRDGVVLVGGRPLGEDDAHALVSGIDDMPPRPVPPGHLFVLGDNRPISCDSREFGLVPVEAVKGKVRLRFWPFDALSIF